MRFLLGILLISSFVGVAPGALAQESPKPLPKVIQHEEPVYPPLARQARIQGEVRVKFTTNGDSVVSAEAETGHPILRKAAEDNVRTWKFQAHEPGTFAVTFRYRFLAENGEVAFLQSPDVVELAAQLPIVNIDYAEIGLGRWKAQLKSAHGKFQEIFDFYYSGPEGEWLGGRTTGLHSQDEEIDFGYIKDKLFGFTVILSRPGGKRSKIFFTGKINGDKIKGAFVDDYGVTGEWTALRESNNIPQD